jgi:molecular chaperone GrpE (heat shock protein)
VAEIAERMTAEAKAFGEFMQKAQDAEKQHLRLEVDKLRRAEGDWLQVMVLMMDHVYALYRAAVASRKPSVIEQISHFQRACREVARRIGLIPFEIKPGDTYDARVHQLEKPDLAPSEGQAGQVEATLAPGYTFQGQALRKPLVTLAKPAPTSPQTRDLFQDASASPEPSPATLEIPDPQDPSSLAQENPSLQTP